MMDNIEWAIKMLKSCLDDCGYGANLIYLIMGRIQKVIELLKGYRPRVLLLQDLEQWERAVWFEDREEDVCYIALIANTDQYAATLANVEPGYHQQMDFLNSYYAKDWRCWSEKPTEEQRKAVPWEEA